MRRCVRLLAAFLAAVLALGLAACSSDGSSDSQKKTPSTALTLENDGVDEAAFTAALAQFPKTPAATVVTTSMPLAELMHTLGINVVGIPSSTTLKVPAGLENVAKIGNAMAPDVEQIVKLTPGLVVASEASRSTIEKSLAATGLPSAFLRTDNLADLKLAVKVLGTAFAKPEQLKTTMESVLKQENQLIKHQESTKQQKVLVLIGTSSSFMVMNNKTFLGSLLERAGADNIAVSTFNATETYSAIDLEAIVAAAPDVVLVLQAGTVAATQAAFDKEVEKNAAWKSLPAYTNKKITVLDYQVFSSTALSALEPAVTGLLPLIG